MLFWLLPPAAAAAYLRWGMWQGSWAATLFRVAYLLYAKTPVGRLIHANDLRQSDEPHSSCLPHDYGSVVVLPIPVLGDNYAYLVVDKASGHACAVDPADADAVVEAVQSFGEQLEDLHVTGHVDLQAVLTTHYHLDHAGGNERLAQLVPAVADAVYGGALERVQAMTRPMSHGDEIALGETKIQVLATPCHTEGHVSYYLPEAGLVFTGDTLFVGGCGKFFEGSADQMAHSLHEVLGRLPGATKVYPGHEYAVPNLEFAAWLEPDNRAAADKLRWAEEQREQRHPTVPSDLAEERLYNPYLRAEVILRMPLAEAMAEVRRLKDTKAHKGGAGAAASKSAEE